MTTPTPSSSRFLFFATSFGVAALTIYLLVSGRDILIPIALAVMAWFLLNAVATAIRRVRIGGYLIPRWAALTLTVIGFVATILAVVELVSGSFDGVLEAAPKYQENLQRRIVDGAALLGVEAPPNLKQLAERVDVRSLVGTLAGTLTAIAGNVGIIVVYVLFLFVEQGTFNRKLSALFPDETQGDWVRRILGHMTQEIQSYLWIKTLVSMLTGGLSYAVLAGVGVDFAEFWAIIIFFLNYIPTIGSLLGIIFPALLTLVQFDSLNAFFIVTPCLVVIQVFVGNLLEPMLMGTTLNISPFVTLISLAVWGSIWGVPGMFMCVPITVIVMIVFAHFPRTRGISILLSSNGRVSWGDDPVIPRPER